MADKKENIKALFSNTRSRVIIIFTLILVLLTVIIGIIKFNPSTPGIDSTASVGRGAGGIQSIPGSQNQTAQYAALQQAQNIELAKEAEKKGGSAIPTIIRSHAFGEGVQIIGQKSGEGGVSFTALANQDLNGPQNSLWMQSLKDSNCSQDSLNTAFAQGALLSDIRTACSCQQLKVNGIKLTDLEPVCTCDELKKAGFGIVELKDAGFTATRLRLCGYVACDERGVGFNAQQMKDAGFSDGELKGAGFTAQEIARAGGLPDGMTIDDVRNAGCSVDGLKRLRASGVSAAAIRRISGCSAQQMKAAGFSAADLVAAGFSAADLKQAGFTASELKAAGMSARDLLNAGFTGDDLANAGFSNAEVKAAESVLPLGLTPNDIKNAGCSPDAIKRERLAGVSAMLIKRYAECSANALKNAGFSTDDLLNAGFKPSDINSLPFVSDQSIRAAGCDPSQLKQLLAQGVSAKRIHDLNGCSLDALKKAGFDAQSLLNAGFTPAQLMAAGFTPGQIQAAQDAIDSAIRASGCDPAKLKILFAQGVSAKRIHDLNGCSLDALKQAGFDAGSLLKAGFTPAQLQAAGFTPQDIRDAQNPLISDSAIRAMGCDPDKLKTLLAQGVSAKRIHDLNGCSIDALKQAGFDAKSLLNAGFTPAQLQAAGFTPGQIQAAQDAIDSAIRASGCDPEKLKALFAQGVSAKRIHDLNGCSLAALKQAGFDAGSLLDAGFTPAQLQAAGFTPEEIRDGQNPIVSDAAIRAMGCDPDKLKILLAQGVSAKRIHDLNGCSIDALKKAGFDAQSLLNAGFTPAQLQAAGFTPQEIRAAQEALDKAILAAGCDPDKLKALFAQGVSAKRIHDLSGCSLDALKKAGFDAGSLLNAGFTPAQLLAAGFTPQQIRTGEHSPVSDQAIKAMGCDPDKLKALFAQGVSAKRIHDLNGCSLDALKQAGFDAGSLLAAGFTPAQLQAAGFSPQQIQAAQAAIDKAILAAGCDPDQLKALFAEGVTAKRIHDLSGCSLDALKKAGFDAGSLLDAGFTPAQLQAAGFTPAQILAATQPKIDDQMIRAMGCDPAKLKTLFSEGVSAKRIHDLNGCSAEALKNAGFDAASLANAGFTPAELLNAGFSPADLMKAGLVPTAIVATGRTANCSVSSLNAARALGVSAATIKQTLGCSAQAMKDAGYSAADLKNAGFTAAELKNAGFSLSDLKNAGYTAQELRAAGFSAKQLKDAGFSAQQIKDAGFSAAEMRSAGFDANQLKALGFDAAALKGAGFSAKDLLKAGFSAKDLKGAGFGDAEIKAAGFSNDQLQDAGLSTVVGLTPIAPPAQDPSTIQSIAGLNKADAAKQSNAQQLADVRSLQEKQQAAQRHQQKIQQRTSAMLAAANQTMQAWKVVPAQAYVGGSEKSAAAGAAGGMGAAQTSPGLMNSQASVGNASSNSTVYVKTGDIMFAVIDTAVNTDEPGPILATMVSGPLKGAKLIGSFHLPSNASKMIVSFNTISIPGVDKTISISAYAIDPNTARTALSSQTDHHYMSRYGALFASTFIEGFGNAFQSANTTITVGGTGGTTNTTVSNGVGNSLLENAVIGLATVGKAWGQVAAQNMSRPTTIDLYAGTGVGVLFTQDVKII